MKKKTEEAAAVTAVTKKKVAAVNKTDEASGKLLLRVYATLWCLHQLVPFWDKLMQLAGVSAFSAMDNRMLSPADYVTRLPAVLLALVAPHEATLLLAHVLNVASWFRWMPNVWDYMVWCALLECGFICVALLGGSSASLGATNAQLQRAMLLVLYFSAAFWKVTTGWFDLNGSCAPTLMSELFSTKLFDFPPVLRPALIAVIKLSPHLVAGLEFAVPLGLWLAPRFGVVLGLIFHQTINLMPVTYAGGFSIAMCTRLHLFLPTADLSAALKNSPSTTAVPSLLSSLPPWLTPYVVPAGIVSLVAAAMYAVHGRADTAGMLFLLVAAFYLRVALNPVTAAKRTAPAPLPMRAYSSAVIAMMLVVATVYGYVGPILGLQSMGSSNMYSNTLQYGRGNHYLVPTFMLQHLYRERSPLDVHALTPESSVRDVVDAHLADAFGGGLVRVDRTSSMVLQEFATAEVSLQLPKRARSFLEEVGHSGHYFEMYARRNYFERPLFSLATSSIHSGNATDTGEVHANDLPYVQSVYEMRRVLALARARGEHFELVYTKLPASMQANVKSWKSYVGPTTVIKESANAATRDCAVLEFDASGNATSVSPCENDEPGLLGPPPTWLQKILLPYPIALTGHDDVDCST